MTDHVLRNPSPPAVAPAPIIAPVDVVGVSSPRVREDFKAASITLQVSTGDRLLCTMTPETVDAMIDALQGVRRELTSKGVTTTIQFEPIHTVSIAVQDVDGTPLVGIVIDRALVSARGYLIPPSTAKIIAREMRKSVETIRSMPRRRPSL